MQSMAAHLSSGIRERRPTNGTGTSIGSLRTPRFPPGERWLVDLGTARGAPIITDEVIAEVGERLNAKSDTLNEMRVAIVPNGTWEKARQLVDREVSIPGLRAILFNELSVACAWLGLPPGEIGSILESIRTELRGASPNQAER